MKIDLLPMIRAVLLALSVFFIGFPSDAQDIGTAMNINDVKRHPEKYIFAEFTSASPDEAMENARTILTDAIINAISPEVEDRRSRALTIAENAIPIFAKRGTLHRTFLYVNRSHISGEQQEEKQTIALTNEDESTAHPKVSEMTIQDNCDVIKDSIANKMLRVTKASEIQPFVISMKQTGEISDFGRLKSLPVEGKCYVFIFDKNNDVIAWLKKDDTAITNIITNNPQQISDFKGCGCIWFR